MIKIKVNNLKGNEVLAKHVLSATGIELIAAGTVIKEEYIEKMKILQIEEVFIEENDISKKEEGFNLLTEVVKEESIVIVKNVLEKHIYKNTSDLDELCQVADDIINNVMSEEEIMSQVTNIRETKRDLYSHSLNVCALSTVLALKIGYSKEQVADIAKGSLLHDIGLRYVVTPYENVNIEGLPAKSQSEIKKHVIYGYDSIKDVLWLNETSKNIVLLHHERNNGTGYPFKNYAASISDPIKIVAVCDTFDSLIGGMGYESMKVHEAVEYMKQKSVSELDENYVEILLRMVAMYPIGIKVKTNEGEIGVVIKQNKTNIERPIIKIIKDRCGNDVEELITRDLMSELTIFIEEVIDE